MKYGSPHRDPTYRVEPLATWLITMTEQHPSALQNNGRSCRTFPKFSYESDGRMCDLLQVNAVRRTLTRAELADRERLESRIERAMKSHLAAAMALREIRDRRLYRADFDTFEAYC